MAVLPDFSKQGLGSFLLNQAEIIGREKGCDSVVLYVLDARTDLFDFYLKKGYICINNELPTTVIDISPSQLTRPVKACMFKKLL